MAGTTADEDEFMFAATIGYLLAVVILVSGFALAPSRATVWYGFGVVLAAGGVGVAVVIGLLSYFERQAAR